jgi:hypothetical protein
MPTCPKCLTEYNEGILVCADCNVELENIVFIECSNCKEKVDQLLPFCPHCGYTLEGSKSDSPVECEEHHDNLAIGICVICGKPVCSECALLEDGKIFCQNDEHVEIFEDWAVVYTCEAEYEAQMVKSNLEMTGLKAMIFSQRDSVFYGNIGYINVMVPKIDVTEAEKVIEKINNGELNSEEN